MFCSLRLCAQVDLVSPDPAPEEDICALDRDLPQAGAHVRRGSVREWICFFGGHGLERRAVAFVGVRWWCPVVVPACALERMRESARRGRVSRSQTR